MATKRRGRNDPKHLLSIAAFCTRVLEDRRGSMSGIHFIEYVTISVPPDRDPEKRESISLWALIAFKSREPGDLTGDHILRLVLRTPTGKKIGIGEFPMKLESHVTGFNSRIKVDLNIKTQGLYWMDVILDEKRYTSMPLRILFQSVVSAPAEEGP